MARNYTKRINYLGILIVTFAIILVGWLYQFGTILKSKAMDIYHGKTTLQVTYKDSVATDSVVVFKVEVFKDVEE